MRDSFANKVRTAAQEFRVRGRTFTSADLAESIGIQEYKQKKLIYTALYDLVKSGEIERVDGHTFACTGRSNSKLQKRKVMWSYFRMRMKCGAPVTVEELQATANASAKYAREWLGFLTRTGFAKELGQGRFQLLKDPVEMPTDDGKAVKLRDLREKKRKEVATILEEICKMALQAKGMLGELSD